MKREKGKKGSEKGGVQRLLLPRPHMFQEGRNSKKGRVLQLGKRDTLFRIVGRGNRRTRERKKKGRGKRERARKEIRKEAKERKGKGSEKGRGENEKGRGGEEGSADHFIVFCVEGKIEMAQFSFHADFFLNELIFVHFVNFEGSSSFFSKGFYFIHGIL